MKNLELKIYELIGIKTFKKMAFKFREIILYPFMFKMTKEEKNDLLNSASNYHLKKGNNLDNLKNFKKQLLLNTGIHIMPELLCIPYFISIISGLVPLAKSIMFTILMIINTYCLILQRYNWVRINKVIKKNGPKEEAKKQELRSEIIKKDSLLKEHSYKIIYKRKKEMNISIDDLLKDATIEQLEKYKRCLRIYKEYEDYINCPQYSISNNKELRLEYKKSK